MYYLSSLYTATSEYLYGEDFVGKHAAGGKIDFHALTRVKEYSPRANYENTLAKVTQNLGIEQIEPIHKERITLKVQFKEGNSIIQCSAAAAVALVAIRAGLIVQRELNFTIKNNSFEADLLSRDEKEREEILSHVSLFITSRTQDKESIYFAIKSLSSADRKKLPLLAKSKYDIRSRHFLNLCWIIESLKNVDISNLEGLLKDLERLSLNLGELDDIFAHLAPLQSTDRKQIVDLIIQHPHLCKYGKRVTMEILLKLPQNERKSLLQVSQGIYDLINNEALFSNQIVDPLSKVPNNEREGIFILLKNIITTAPTQIRPYIHTNRLINDLCALPTLQERAAYAVNIQLHQTNSIRGNR